MQMRTLVAGALSLGMALVSSNAFAAAWVTPNGNNGSFMYAGGGDDKGLFGNPTVFANGFSFLPNNFHAISSGGVTNSGSITTDRLYVTVASSNGDKSITGISIAEHGDYSINNGGGVAVGAVLWVQVLDAVWNGPRLFSSILSTPGLPFSTAGNATGIWSGSTTVNLPAAASRVQILLDNTLHANSSSNGTAIIQKKFVASDDGPGLTIVFFPEPGSLAALGGLSMLMVRRRTA